MKIRSLLVLLLVVVSMDSASAGTDGTGYSWWPTLPSIGFISEETTIQSITGVSYVKGLSTTSEGGLYTKEIDCTSVQDVACSKSQSISANLYLPPCSTLESNICIASLEISPPDGKLQQATLDHQISSQKIPATPSRGVPFGGAISLWKTTNTPNSAGSNEYSAAVRIQIQNLNNDKCPEDPKFCNFDIANFAATVVPVNSKSGNYTTSPNFASDSKKYDPRNAGCAWSETGVCALPAEFAPNTVVALTLHMDSRLTGFLNGRMKEVKVSIKPLSAILNEIRVEAKPVDIPSVHAFIAKTDLAKYPSINTFWKDTRRDLYKEDISSKDTIATGPPPGFNMSFFEAFSDMISAGSSTKSLWRFTSSGSFSGGTNKCLSDQTKLLGLVTTNASAYSAGPPTFDSKTATINYQVGGAHLDNNGDVFRGTYDLAIRSDVARCLYGFIDAPFKASVSVIGGDGNEQTIATEIIKEDAKREWLFLSAQNFTFSSPTIRVKLTQDQKLAPQKTINKKTVAKITINCTKNKVIKKISGSKPVCPNGYKINKLK